jgi:HD superfamily phosphohydrolase
VERVALLADPLYGYIQFTVPRETDPAEPTEKALIDSPWVQRLRFIHQLQSTWWVYPSGEHSRFQHSLGTMHMAGRFAEQLYPSLGEACRQLREPCPSFPLVHATLRAAGLLHDVGHGPFSHFFDENFLQPRFRLTHEILGQRIIVQKLGTILHGLRRSPAGPFPPRERVEPRWVAFLIRKPAEEDEPAVPRWVRLLRPVFSGIYTADNLDYIQRDAYMTGFSLEMVDIDRLLFYTFVHPKGLTIHRAGVPVLVRFLQARVAMYSDVYYHRTNRAVDLQMREVFAETMAELVPESPARRLNRYLGMTEWFLLQKVQEWAAPGARGVTRRQRALGRGWRDILARRVKWKMAYDRVLSLDEADQGKRFRNADELKREIRRHLPSRLRDLPFEVDLATQDTRPLNPLAEGAKTVNVFNPATGEVSPSPLREFFQQIPPKVAHCRIFARNHRHDRALAEAAERALGGGGPEASTTNL